MSLFADLARLAKKGRRAVRTVERAVSAAERGATDLRAAAEALGGMADAVNVAVPHARRVLGSVEATLVRAGATGGAENERIRVAPAPPPASAPSPAARTRRPAPPPFDPQRAEVVDAEIVDAPPRPTRHP